MSTILAALLVVAVIATTYLTCVRPMRRGHHDRPDSAAELDRQLAVLQEELRVLRAQDTPRD